MIETKLGKGFVYDPTKKRLTYSIKEYVRSKHSFNKGNVDQYLVCVYLLTTNMHFYINDESMLETFLFHDYHCVEHEEIQERLYHTDYTFSIESEEKGIVGGIREGSSRYILTDELHEALKDEQKIQIAEYITFHQEL